MKTYILGPMDHSKTPKNCNFSVYTWYTEGLRGEIGMKTYFLGPMDHSKTPESCNFGVYIRKVYEERLE